LKSCLTISGIGPNSQSLCLSGINAEPAGGRDSCRRPCDADADSRHRQKTAERVVLELKTNSTIWLGLFRNDAPRSLGWSCG